MIRSEQFDDIYFSRNNGYAEVQHVFLNGNNLPAAWEGRARFCIGELGFGTGLNILSVWKLFEEMAGPEQRLDIVSVEKHPLTAAQIREALAEWNVQLGGYVERLLKVYPMRIPGFHQVHLSDRVTLTLIFDDVHVALPAVQAQVNAWFLDGFAPAKNPDMWSDDVFAQLARLSATGATAASFTAVGHVRRRLAAAGFDVKRAKGHGYKYHMTTARFNGRGAAARSGPARVAVMGAGLAGASAAWHLRRAGVDVVVCEAGPEIAHGASGNSAGLINPKLTVQRGAQSDYYAVAYAYALRVLSGLQGVGFLPHGSLHVQMDADKARRFAGYIDNLGWDAAHMVMLDASQASDVAGVPIEYPCLFYPDAAVASPRAICRALLADIPVQFNVTVPPEADAVVWANAGAYDGLALQRVRGQVSRLVPSVVSAGLKTNMCYGGYISPVLGDGLHMCGATFQPWDVDPTVRGDDHAYNVAQLEQVVPSLAGLSAVDGWTGFRTASKDRFPLVGQHRGGWCSVAHGSHGMISGLMAGAVLAASLGGGVQPVGAASLQALDPGRFG